MERQASGASSTPDRAYIERALHGRDFEEAVRRAREPRELDVDGRVVRMIDVAEVPGALRIPRASVRFLENVIRRAPSDEAAIEGARRVVEAGLEGTAGEEIEFSPSRVLFQDFTGVPIFVDFAAMRDAMVAQGGDPETVNPKIPCVLVVDHSVQADCTGEAGAAELNLAIEARRNAERFSFLKWAQKSFDNVEIVPPGQGICHQLGVERFWTLVAKDALAEDELWGFDTLVGSDSHTTTANGLGVMSWGLGGIECEAAALGLSLPMRVPEVVGLTLKGALGEGVQAMDLALTLTQLLREKGVVGKIVEVSGEGVATLSATQRACVANMTPEYGATATLFPVDEETLAYLALTGRSADEVALAEAYYRAQGVFGAEGRDVPRVYSEVIEFDLSDVEPCLAGPSRPHNRVRVADLGDRVLGNAAAHGHGDAEARFEVELPEGTFSLAHGSLALAAITSCTTATDAAMIVSAALLAKNARDRGLAAAPWVKCILGPGSRATSRLLEESGLAEPLAELGFSLSGWGCLACIGNSGPLAAPIHELAGDVEFTSVLSGNRNFDGRISPDVAQNYICAPSLVVAYAIKGTMVANLEVEPLGFDAEGEPVMLADVLPDPAEVAEILEAHLTPELYAETADLASGGAAWDALVAPEGTTYPWDPASTYIRRPPYFEDARPAERVGCAEARCLALLGDFVTTDHISPAGSIASGSPAARYLEERGVKPEDFNTYGARRGNHEVMERGTFANPRLQNALAKGKAGGFTIDPVSGELTSIWDASERAREAGVELILLAGKMYGSGSSRDWAAKGPALLGVRCVVAESFERIHRSNLVGMGILPLELDGVALGELGLTGRETFHVEPVEVALGKPAPKTTLTIVSEDGTERRVACRVRIDTPTEALYMAKGGILPYVLSDMA